MVDVNHYEATAKLRLMKQVESIYLLSRTSQTWMNLTYQAKIHSG